MAARKPNCLRDKKIAIVFNEDARREYLLGFRKRKNDRRRKAQEQIQKLEREKKKQTKEEKKKIFIEQVEKQKQELEALESDDSSDDIITPSINATFEHPEHVVTVTTIDDIDLTGNSFSCTNPSKCVSENKDTLLSAPSEQRKPTEKVKKFESRMSREKRNSKKAKSKKLHKLKGSLHKNRSRKTGKKRKGPQSMEKSKRTKRS